MGFLVCTLVFLIVFKVILKLTNGVCTSNSSLLGKTVLVTGGTSGIGYQTVLGLAARGARVIVASRNVDEQTTRNMIEITRNPNIIAKKLDLSSLQSVRDFVSELKRDEEKLDILVNNAGTGGLGNTYTKDGLNTVMATNHFAPTLLTILLIDLMKKSESPKIIFVSSLMAFLHKIKSPNDINNPYGDKAAPSNVTTDNVTYCNSKLCNIVISNVLAKKLKPFNFIVNSLHPGAVRTPIFNQFFTNYLPEFVISIMLGLVYFFYKHPQEGAQTTLHVALSDDVKQSGKFYVDCCKFFQPSAARNVDFCRKVWEQMELLVKLKNEEKI